VKADDDDDGDDDDTLIIEDDDWCWWSDFNAGVGVGVVDWALSAAAAAA
jgi:hypothetical protein